MVDADEYRTDRRQAAERRSTNHRDVKTRRQESAAIGKYGAHERGRNQATKPLSRIVQAGRDPGATAIHYSQHEC